jgi:hypothetical protein
MQLPAEIILSLALMEYAAVSEHRPHDTCIFIRQSNRGDIRITTASQIRYWQVAANSFM